MGLITKEDYFKERDENFYNITDSEDEQKEKKRLDSKL